MHASTGKTMIVAMAVIESRSSLHLLVFSPVEMASEVRDVIVGRLGRLRSVARCTQ